MDEGLIKRKIVEMEDLNEDMRVKFNKYLRIKMD